MQWGAAPRRQDCLRGRDNAASADKLDSRAIKELVKRASLAPDEEFLAALKAFFVSTSRPGWSRLTALLDAGFQQDSDVERNLGRLVAEASF